ncbi:hypothetical protein F4V43_09920 [Paenibacillus spiritus]|uniref:SAF domain-containing protein n=1 Tax=Paenibacillus spiritus TaxID=2496557 RepID=A0A5J5GA77_9BACL|nr:hypothetical protein [Paenibacillus spiritus]KAA9004928.1 hypothetical protein F4V43_09920 [Paenibacillus spiritus]
MPSRSQWLRRNVILAVLVLVTGFGGLLAYDLYIKPYVLARTVVKVKVADYGLLPKNRVLLASDLYLDSVQSQDVPEGALVSLGQAEGKMANVSLTDGMILTESLVDVSNLEPGPGEGIFPVPKESIYAINGSLRSRDKVDLYLIQGSADRPLARGEGGELSGNEVQPPSGSLFLSGVTVNYVRTEDNNDVRDTENGNDNHRFTSTGKVAVPELRLARKDGEALVKALGSGCRIWIVRVE